MESVSYLLMVVQWLLSHLFADDTRDGYEMVRSLQNEEIIVGIMSGDEQSSVESFAKKMEIDPNICRGNIEALKVKQVSFERSRRTLMAGDGLTIQLSTAADIEVAVGSSDQSKSQTLDVLILGDDPEVIVELIPTR